MKNIFQLNGKCLTVLVLLRQFLFNIPILYPLTRRPLVFLCFQGVQNDKISQNGLKIILLVF